MSIGLYAEQIVIAGSLALLALFGFFEFVDKKYKQFVAIYLFIDFAFYLGWKWFLILKPFTTALLISMVPFAASIGRLMKAKRITVYDYFMIAQFIILIAAPIVIPHVYASTPYSAVEVDGVDHYEHFLYYSNIVEHTFVTFTNNSYETVITTKTLGGQYYQYYPFGNTTAIAVTHVLAFAYTGNVGTFVDDGKTYAITVKK